MHKNTLKYLLARVKTVESMKDIAAYNVAKYIKFERDIEALEMPQSLRILVSDHLYRRYDFEEDESCSDEMEDNEN